MDAPSFFANLLGEERLSPLMLEWGVRLLESAAIVTENDPKTAPIALREIAQELRSASNLKKQVSMEGGL